MERFPSIDRLRVLDEVEERRERRRREVGAIRESRRQEWGSRNEGHEVVRDKSPPPGRLPAAVLDERMIQRSVLTVMPKSGPAATSAMGRIFAGLVPVDQAVRVPTDGKAATSMIRAMLRVKISKASRHAVPLLETYVGSYDVRSIDKDRERIRATMAIGRVTKHLRERGYQVGVACPTVDGTIFAVPYLIDPAAPDPRQLGLVAPPSFASPL